MFRSSTVLLGSILIAGCLPHKRSVAPLELADLSFAPSGTDGQPDEWWTAFDDEAMNAVVARGLDDNFSIAAARARMDAARAVVRRERSGLFPSLSGFGSADVSTAGGGITTELGARADLELDIWGRIGAAVRAQVQRTEAAAAAHQAVRIELAAAIASTWVDLAGTREQLALLDTQLEANIRMSEVVQARFLNGVVRQADTLRQDRLLEQTRAERIARNEELEILEHRLAILLGRPPTATLPPLPDRMPIAPTLPDAGVPADLLRRRPDVQVAEHLLYAADAEVAVAITNQFPRVTLGGIVSTAGTPDNLVQGWVASLAGNLLAPIFTAGQRRAEVRRTRAVVEESVALYGDALLGALAEVEDALSRNRYQAELLESVDRQVELAVKTVDGLQVQYIGGLDVGYLDVLTAQTTAQQLRRQQIAERRRLLQVRIDLYRALAGAHPENVDDAE